MELDANQRAARDQFGRQSTRYGKSHILADVTDVEKGLSHLELPGEAEVLDLATGAGHTGIHLAKLGHRVTLSDLAQPMLDQAVARAREEGLQVQTQLHPAESMPNPDARFDLVTCRVAAHHFSDCGAFLKETFRVLRPGGYLLLIDGSVADGNPVAEAWTHEVEKLRDPSHGRFLTPGEWGHLCSEAGLVERWKSLTPFQMPDLNWYFETADTPPQNRAAVLKLVEDCPPEAREVFRVMRQGDTVSWWWQRLTLVACKPTSDADV